MGAARQSTVIPMRFGYLQLSCLAYVEANQKLLLLYSHFDQMLLWPYGDNVTKLYLTEKLTQVIIYVFVLCNLSLTA